MGRQLENAAFWRIDAVYSQLSGTFTRIGKWIQSVDAAGKSTFSTAGGSGNENSLTATVESAFVVSTMRTVSFTWNIISRFSEEQESHPGKK